MTGVTTGQTSLATATDSDDTEGFLTGPLTAVLQAIANLFESATGHDHTGPGKGKPVGSAGIASGVALTNPVVGGAGGTPAGTLGFSGTSLLVGDGAVNRAVNVGGWVGFAPTLNQGAAAVAATVNLARYAIIGKLAVVQIQLTATAAGISGNISISALPAAIASLSANGALPVGTFYYQGAANRSGVVIQNSTTTLVFFVDNNAGYLGGAPVVTLANTHILAVNAAWEIA